MLLGESAEGVEAAVDFLVGGYARGNEREAELVFYHAHVGEGALHSRGVAVDKQQDEKIC